MLTIELVEKEWFTNKIIIDDLEYLYKNNIVDWERFRNKTVLVTGAYGVIATYFVYLFIYLNELNPDYNIKIIALCRDEKKLFNKFGEYIYKKYFTIYKSHLKEKIILMDVKVDYIIHAASPAGTQHFKESPVDVIVPNAIGTYNLLEYAKEHDLDGFLFLSSNSIYGVNAELESITEEEYGIVDPLNMRSCYIESKRLGEQMCNAYFRQYNLHTKIVRLSHTYGPTIDIINDKRAIARFFSNILTGEDITLFKDESAKVQYIYIADVILGCIKILLDGNDGEAYNICSDEFLPMHEIAEILVSIFPDWKSKVRYKSITNEYAFGQNQGINNLKCSNEKIKKLGWMEEYPLAKGFKRTIESYEMSL